MPEAGPELSVVCKSCGAEVSPYVTECPYCGTRLRKRAPKLERRGDELAAKETRRDRRERRRRAAASERASRALATAGRPYATLVAMVAPCVVYVLVQAGVFDLFEVGVVARGGGLGFLGDPSSEPWRFLAAPWIYDDAGYLFVCGLALAIFALGIERRIGSIPTALLLIACGALGMLAAYGIAEGLDWNLLAAGGNGVALGAVAAWAAMRWSESKAFSDDAADWMGVAVAAAVLLLLPLVEDFADPIAGIAGGLVGGACGFVATRVTART